MAHNSFLVVGLFWLINMMMANASVQRFLSIIYILSVIKRSTELDVKIALTMSFKHYSGWSVNLSIL